MEKICTAVVAHVDAGKTTLSESILYNAKAIRVLGRVDHGDSFLDTNSIERKRGITIFSKQAMFTLGDKEFTLLDTPGHSDFSTETERTLSVLDYCILVISGTSGVQSHTKTLWKLLEHYNIPVFIFINKTDLANADTDKVMEQLNELTSGKIVPFSQIGSDNFYDSLATCNEEMLEMYLEKGFIGDDLIKKGINSRELFPVVSGSALKNTGINSLLEIMKKYMTSKDYPNSFSARVFKITFDDSGNRLTHLKVTGGSLKVREIPEGLDEKVNQLRIYSGEKYETLNEAVAGTICTVTGLSKTYAGMTIGKNPEITAVTQPVMSYRVNILSDTDVFLAYRQIKLLQEEDPSLQITWNERFKEIYIHIMGNIQLEVTKEIVKTRFNLDVDFEKNSIVYKETIKNVVEGVGHYEPLRHYAEAHFLLEPGKPGSGMTFESVCPTDTLDINYQKLILSHCKEKAHLGVLTGAPVTDIKITLLSGKSHIKHTEGGDFRQATYRGIRQGLMQAESVLLEPFYDFRIEVPSENIGRAMTDLQNMGGTFESPLLENDMSILVGRAPVATIDDYAAEINSYTKGLGHISLSLAGYFPCHNAEEVIANANYDPESDTDNPSSSVFCENGSGKIVTWDKVPELMHLPFSYNPREKEENTKLKSMAASRESKKYDGTYVMDKELEAIFEKEFGPVKRINYNETTTRDFNKPKNPGDPKYIKDKSTPQKPKYLLVDGYNIIHAWDNLKALAADDLHASRMKLLDILSNYQGFKGINLIVVFDAYKVKGNPGEVSKFHNINLVYTKEAETADMYIEKVAHNYSDKYDITVATSDALEQLIVMSKGAKRMSARELLEEIKTTVSEGLENYHANK